MPGSPRSSSGVAPVPEVVDLSSMPKLATLIDKGMRVIGSLKTACPPTPRTSTSSTTSSLECLIFATVFGQQCELCDAKDHEPDPVFPDRKTYWGYPVDTVTGRNRGSLFKICIRVYRARFRGKYSSTALLKQAFGLDGTLYGMFKHWWDMCLEACRNAQSYDIQVRWGSDDDAKRLQMERSKEARLEAPDDEVWNLEDYMLEHGDFRTNGLGHKWVDYGDGCAGVLVPGKRIWRVKRAKVMRASIIEDFDTVHCQLGENQLDDMLTDLAANFTPEVATGVSLSQLLPPQPIQPALPDGLASSSQPVMPVSSLSSFLTGSAQQSVQSQQLASQQQHQQAALGLAPPPFFGRFSPGTMNGALNPRAAVAQAKAQTVPNAGGAASPRAGGKKGNKGHLGRKPQCVMERTTELLAKFESALQNDIRFYGAEKAAQSKCTLRLLEDAKAAAEKDDITEESRSLLQIASKKVHFVNEICKATNRFGLGSEAFGQAYDGLAHFMTLAPAVTGFGAPAWMQQARFRSKAMELDMPHSGSMLTNRCWSHSRSPRRQRRPRSLKLCMTSSLRWCVTTIWNCFSACAPSRRRRAMSMSR